MADTSILTDAVVSFVRTMTPAELDAFDASTHEPADSPPEAPPPGPATREQAAAALRQAAKGTTP